MIRLSVGLACIALLATASVSRAQPPEGSPRRTRQVKIIDRCGSSVAAVFSQTGPNTWSSGSGSVIHRDGYSRLAKGLHPVRIEFFEATGEADLQVVLIRDGSSVKQETRYFFDVVQRN
jgi:hypothetical protein